MEDPFKARDFKKVSLDIKSKFHSRDIYLHLFIFRPLKIVFSKASSLLGRNLSFSGKARRWASISLQVVCFPKSSPITEEKYSNIFLNTFDPKGEALGGMYCYSPFQQHFVCFFKRKSNTLGNVFPNFINSYCLARYFFEICPGTSDFIIAPFYLKWWVWQKNSCLRICHR